MEYIYIYELGIDPTFPMSLAYFILKINVNGPIPSYFNQS